MLSWIETDDRNDKKDQRCFWYLIVAPTCLTLGYDPGGDVVKRKRNGVQHN